MTSVELALLDERDALKETVAKLDGLIGELMDRRLSVHRTLKAVEKAYRATEYARNWEQRRRRRRADMQKFLAKVAELSRQPRIFMVRAAVAGFLLTVAYLEDFRLPT